MRAPLLGAITLDETGGGIAVVSKLLWRAFTEHWGDAASLVTMFDHANRRATFAEKARFSLRVGRAEAAGGTDWVLFSHLALSRIQMRMPALLRRPYGIFLHGIEAWTPLSDVELRAMAEADLLVANSRYTAERVMAMHPTVGRVESCSLALCPSSCDAEEEPAPVPSLGPRAVLVVGRMVRSERYKGHDQIIAAWPAVLRRAPDAQLVIVGEGDDRARLEAEVAARHVEASVTFTGFVSRPTLRSLYRRAAVFALPSRGEGFGLVYLEAMSHRVPCIGSVHDAAPEVIADGITGRLVDPDNEADLAGTLATLLLDEPQRRAMGEAGYARATNEFSFERFSARMRELLSAAPTDRHPRSA